MFFIFFNKNYTNQTNHRCRVTRRKFKLFKYFLLQFFFIHCHRWASRAAESLFVFLFFTFLFCFYYSLMHIYHAHPYWIWLIFYRPDRHVGVVSERRSFFFYFLFFCFFLFFFCILFSPGLPPLASSQTRLIIIYYRWDDDIPGHRLHGYKYTAQTTAERGVTGLKKRVDGRRGIVFKQQKNRPTNEKQNQTIKSKK